MYLSKKATRNIGAILLTVTAITVCVTVAVAQDVIGDRIKGNLVYIDRGAHLKRLVGAIGPGVVVFNEDFVHFTDAGAGSDPVGWTTTMVETGAGGDSDFDSLDGSGGFGRMTTDNADNDGVSAQLNGEAFELTSDQVLYCGFFGVTINDVTQTDTFIGLAITDTAILGGVTDRIGFENVDAAATLDFVLEKNNTQTTSSTVHTLVDATAVDLEFYFDGTNIEVFVDGASVATPAVTNLPDDEQLRVSLEFLTGEAVANTADIDRITCIQLGR